MTQFIKSDILPPIIQTNPYDPTVTKNTSLLKK